VSEKDSNENSSVEQQRKLLDKQIRNPILEVSVGSKLPSVRRLVFSKLPLFRTTTKVCRVVSMLLFEDMQKANSSS